MIERHLLEAYAVKAETSFRNALREYVQHLFLASFYKKALSEKFLFKGGTALRLVFGSPRFSEDIDFSGLKNTGGYERILEDVLLGFSFENLRVDLIESKPTSGGHLAILEVILFGEKIEIRNEISFRPKKLLSKELAVIGSEITPFYKVYTLNKKMMVAEKIEALIARQKPRDFFDLYFILRKEELRQALKLETKQRKVITVLLESQDKAEISRELRRLLPKSFWHLIKNLPMVLKRELN